MGSELWEKVRADQVKAGDVVSAYPVHAEMEVTEEILGTWVFEDEDDFMYRRVDPADDPRVLRRALESAVENWYENVFRMQTDEHKERHVAYRVAMHINDAIRELESEGQNGQ